MQAVELLLLLLVVLVFKVAACATRFLFFVSMVEIDGIPPKEDEEKVHRLALLQIPIEVANAAAVVLTANVVNNAGTSSSIQRQPPSGLL